MAKDNWTPAKSEAKIWRILDELAASQKQTDIELKELAASQKQAGAELREDLKELAASQKRTDAEIEKLIVTQKNTSKELGGIGQNLGGLAEDFFYYNAPAAMKKDGFHVDYYDRNIAYNDELDEAQSREYDIIGVNGDYVIVIEVKAMLRKKHINEFIKLLPHFAKDFPEHKGKKIYGGIAGMSLDQEEEVREVAEEKGLLLLTQAGSDAAEVRKPGNDIASLKNFGKN